MSGTDAEISGGLGSISFSSTNPFNYLAEVLTPNENASV